MCYKNEYQKRAHGEVEQIFRELLPEAVREAISGNLCRCTGYVKIEAAIRMAAERSR